MDPRGICSVCPHAQFFPTTMSIKACLCNSGRGVHDHAQSAAFY